MERAAGAALIVSLPPGLAAQHLVLLEGTGRIAATAEFVDVAVAELRPGSAVASGHQQGDDDDDRDETDDHKNWIEHDAPRFGCLIVSTSCFGEGGEFDQLAVTVLTKPAIPILPPVF